MVKTNQGTKILLFPNVAFSKFNNVYCEIMRASILCNSNFVGNKYCTLTFVSLSKVALHKESSLCPPFKLLYGNLAGSFDLCVGIVFEPIVVIYVGFPFSKKDRIFVFPHFRNSREKSMRRKLVPIPFTIFGEHGVMAHVP